MRVYAFSVDEQILLLRTSDQIAARLDNDELDMTDVLFTARFIDPAELFATDEDGNPLFSIMM